MLTKLNQIAPNQAQPVAGGIEAARALPELPQLLVNLEGVIADAETAFAGLRERLDPICMHRPTGDAGNQPLHFVAGSPLGGELAVRLNRLRSLVNSINVLAEGLAV